jgi:lipopolysaccharide/colanic/teichoic acid biosynthesis glycosyltransferase
MYRAFGKRAFDILGALLLLAVAAPVALLVAALVWARLGRPILFAQQRAGRGGRPFLLRKFRSMAIGTAPDVERLSGFGRRLRASGLDELPQLLAVLRGEMSLVGPRPLPAAYVAHYSPRQALRLRLRPGIAGPGVAAGRNAVPWSQRLELDAAYAAAGPTFPGDMALLLRTLLVWLSGRGVTAPGHASMPEFRAPDGRPTR